ncbi:MAG: linear amide C-N hydrolase, partial [Actinomycetia bacterium]|nr:linear amide C-N hydrolase [Actinomycetes bacterium]
MPAHFQSGTSAMKSGTACPPRGVDSSVAATTIAIESHHHGPRVVDNPIGVGTNAPFPEWHLTNLNNYVGL